MSWVSSVLFTTNFTATRNNQKVLCLNWNSFLQSISANVNMVSIVTIVTMLEKLSNFTAVNQEKVLIMVTITKAKWIAKATKPETRTMVKW
jgi:hypothetical protein